ncbi:MAG: DUF917 domain-containing protein [Rubrivivax sp.]|nr:DUF917 domain-containing protein [Rubrivivax sp.]
MSRILDIEDIDDIAAGAAVLGCGGGGDPYIGALMTCQSLRGGAPVRLVASADVPDDALVIVIAGIGAPPVLVEKIPNGSESELALRFLEKHLGRRADYLMAAEIGGMNSLHPLQVAAKVGLPVIDADGMGRAFPKLEMTSFHIHGIPVTPMVLANERGDLMLMQTTSDQQAEHFVKHLAVAMGGIMSSAGFALRGAEVKCAAVSGTVSICQDIGRALRESRRLRQDPFDALLAAMHATEYYCHAHLIFEGKVADVERRVTGRHNLGQARIEGPDGVMEISIQNEYLIASRNGRTVAIVPDLVAVLDEDTAQAITAESLRYGQRVRVLAASVPPIMRSEAALRVWGPQAFGIDEPFVPIEQLMAAGD